MKLKIFAQALLPPAVYERLRASDIAKRLAHGSFWSLINALVMKSTTLVQAIVLARILGITGFGEWGILLSTISMLNVIASFGLGVTTTKHVAQWHKTEPNRLGRLLVLIQLVAFTTGLLTWLVLAIASRPLADHLLAAPQLSEALTIAGIIIFLNTISSVYVGIINGLERFRDSAMINGIASMLGAAAIILLAYLYGLKGAIVGLAIASFLNTGPFMYRTVVLLRERSIPLYAKNPLSEWKSIRDFALPTLIAGAIIMAATWVAQVGLVRQPGGLDQMGAYQAASQWRTMISFLPTQLLAAYLPVLSSLLVGKQDNRDSLQRITLLISSIVTLAISLPVVFSAHWVMGLYGPEFEQFWLILLFAALIPIFDIAHVVLQQTAIAHGYVWTLVVSNLAMVASVGVGIVWLIPAYLGVGLAITLLLGYSSRMAAEYLLLRAINLNP